MLWLFCLLFIWFNLLCCFCCCCYNAAFLRLSLSVSMNYLCTFKKDGEEDDEQEQEQKEEKKEKKNMPNQMMCL